MLHAARLARWAGDRTVRDRLVLILHVGYAFVPLGFLLLGAAALDLVPAAAGIHAWTGGAVGTMTLAVMTRASLGHTGHALVASGFTQVIYAAVLASALARIGAAIIPSGAIALLHAAASFGRLPFLGFTLVYGPTLTGSRLRAAV